MNFEKLIAEFTNFSLVTFKDATALSSLEKLKEEIAETEWAIFPGGFDANLLEEYVDCLMCIFDSAARSGINSIMIKQAFEKKLKKNKARKWVKNSNNTYSHSK